MWSSCSSFFSWIWYQISTIKKYNLPIKLNTVIKIEKLNRIKSEPPSATTSMFMGIKLITVITSFAVLSIDLLNKLVTLVNRSMVSSITRIILKKTAIKIETDININMYFSKVSTCQLQRLPNFQIYYQTSYK
jgi:hypothetical protein